MKKNVIRITVRLPRIVRFFLIIALASSYPVELFSQRSNSITSNPGKEQLEFFKYLYGTDDILVNGRVYIPKHYRSIGHPYFENDNWMRGALFIKGRTYSELLVKYDIELDKIILNTNIKNGTATVIELNSEAIDSLYVDNHFFVNSEILKSPILDKNFYEKIRGDKYSLFIGYKKKFKFNPTDFSSYGRFEEFRPFMYISCNGQYSKVSSKRAFLNYFKPHKKEIRKFMRKKKIKLLKADLRELDELMEFCNMLTTE